MNLAPELDSLLAQAQSRAVEQRQALCDAEQVLEALLLARDELHAARPVTRFLEARPELPYHPPSCDLARSVRIRALNEAERVAVDVGAAEITPDHLLQALLSACEKTNVPFAHPHISSVRRNPCGTRPCAS